MSPGEGKRAPASRAGFPSSFPVGEVSELAEGARLESVCTGNRTEGSNPSLSAISCPWFLPAVVGVSGRPAGGARRIDP